MSSELTALLCRLDGGNTCAQGGACAGVARVGMEAIAGAVPGIAGTVVAVEGAEQLWPDGQLAALGLRGRCKLCT